MTVRLFLNLFYLRMSDPSDYRVTEDSNNEIAALVEEEEGQHEEIR